MCWFAEYYFNNDFHLFRNLKYTPIYCPSRNHYCDKLSLFSDVGSIEFADEYTKRFAKYNFNS